MQGTVRLPDGPTPAEERMLAAWDMFSTLLERQPVAARQLAYEIATIVERYNAVPQQKGGC